MPALDRSGSALIQPSGWSTQDLESGKFTVTNGVAAINTNQPGTSRSSDYYPMYNSMAYGGLPPATDESGALVTRAAIVTDEGAFRTSFTGSSLTQSPGTATFTNGSSIVTGSGFSTTDVHYGDFIKLGSHTESAWAQVAFINSDTQITLFSSYTGATGTGTYNVASQATVTGTGATFTVGSGQLTMALGTNTSAQTYVYRGASDGSSIFSVSLSVSQRIANQDIFIGEESNVTGTIKTFSRFHLNGTDNTKVITETGYNPTGAPTSSEQETNTITLPSNLTTAGALIYKIERQFDQVTFYINGAVVATHTMRIPHIMNDGANVVYAGVRGINSGAITATSVVMDYIFIKGFNRIDIPGEDTNTQALKVEQKFNYFHHIGTAGPVSGTVKSGQGFLHGLSFNTHTSAGTYTLYDSVGTSSAVIGVISPGAVAVDKTYDVSFYTGLTIVSGSVCDLTISSR